ncbi:MAG: DUF2090 domain-containing protein, partial [Burkholderiaceae bacterium]
FDHRSQFFDMARACGASEQRIVELKKLLLRSVEQVEAGHGLQGQIGVLIDGGSYGADALAAATGRGWWVGRPVELPGSRPLRFDGTLSIGSALVSWPHEQVVKCLLHYHPDDASELRLEQELKLQELWQATRASGNELLLELICPRALTTPGEEDAVVLRAVQRFYNLGLKPEWWKLAPMQASGWQALESLIVARDPGCRGAVILGLNQPLQALVEGFAQAASSPIVKGFMVGRSLWVAPCTRWLRKEIDDDSLVSQVAENFAFLVDAWRKRAAPELP